MPVRNRFSELLPEIIGWRHDFHAHPEILFDTQRTSKIVAQKLTEFGCDDVITGLGRSGVIGLIHGKRQTSGKTVGLRADMDALPIHEKTALPYASKTDGAMHACGHDGHMAMLLGAAKYLSETRSFDGTVAVIFQPAEEGGGGGREMCNDGMMDRFNISEVYGMHNWPGQSLGSFAIRTGPFFAASDMFSINIEGKGGHAAYPHNTIDSVAAASQVVSALQTIAARNTDPTENIVVSVTSLRSSSNAFNVLPQSVHLRGTLRSLSADIRDLGQRRITELAVQISAALGAKAEVIFHEGYPVMVNAPAQSEFACKAARAVSGACMEAPLVMAGEDFSYMLQERPGAYILLGNGNSEALHHCAYDFNDDAILAGCSWWAEIAEMRLGATDK